MTYSMKPHGLMFHHFHGDEHLPCQGSISADEFEELIRWVGIKRILPAAEWRDRACRGTLRDGDLCISFDDSLKCQIDVALPVLQKYDLTAFWFIYTSVISGGIEMLEIYRHFRHVFFDSLDQFYDEFVNSLLKPGDGGDIEMALSTFDPDAYMTAFPFLSRGDKVFRFLRDDLLGPERYHRAMGLMMERHGADPAKIAPGLWMKGGDVRSLSQAGHVIGLHSHTHPTRMAELPLALQREEYGRNASVLEAVTGCRPDTIGHPCGSYSAETLEMLTHLGVVMGFRANMVQAEYGRLELPREDHANIMRMIREK